MTLNVEVEELKNLEANIVFQVEKGETWSVVASDLMGLEASILLMVEHNLLTCEEQESHIHLLEAHKWLIHSCYGEAGEFLCGRDFGRGAQVEYNSCQEVCMQLSIQECFLSRHPCKMELLFSAVEVDMKLLEV